MDFRKSFDGEQIRDNTMTPKSQLVLGYVVLDGVSTLEGQL